LALGRSFLVVKMCIGLNSASGCDDGHGLGYRSYAAMDASRRLRAVKRLTSAQAANSRLVFFFRPR
jgi:hypothetical protein